MSIFPARATAKRFSIIRNSMNTAKRFSVFLKNMNMGQKPRRRDNGEVSGGGGVWTSDNHKGESLNSRIAALLIRSEEHTSELQSLMRISYAVICLEK